MRLRSYLNKEKLRREGYFKEIINCVSKHMEIDKNKIKTSSGRKREYVQARNMVCSILSGNESITLSKIAETVGYTNHSWVIHAIKMHEIDIFIKDHVSTDIDLDFVIDEALKYNKIYESSIFIDRKTLRKVLKWII